MLISFVIKNWILFWWIWWCNIYEQKWEMTKWDDFKETLFHNSNLKTCFKYCAVLKWSAKGSIEFLYSVFPFFRFLYSIWRFQNFKKFDLSVIFWTDFEELANIILFVFQFPVRWTLLAHFWGRMTVTNGYVLNDTILN